MVSLLFTVLQNSQYISLTNTVFFNSPPPFWPCVAVMADNVFKSHDIGLRAQKKILSRMATKNIAKTFIDGTTASLLDNLYKLCKMHTGNKARAEKLIKNIIKIVIKIGVLHRNNQFSPEELRNAENFKHKFHVSLKKDINGIS